MPVKSLPIAQAYIADKVLRARLRAVGPFFQLLEAIGNHVGVDLVYRVLVEWLNTLQDGAYSGESYEASCAVRGPLDSRPSFP